MNRRDAARHSQHRQMLITLFRDTSFILLLFIIFSCAISADSGASDKVDDDEFDSFEDTPLAEPLSNPPWFKLTFLDLPEDLEDALGNGKQGLMVYFGQKYCSYCKQLLEGNFGMLDILAYTQKHFDIIGIDIHGQREVTALDGSQWDERSFSVRKKVNFTPTLIFLDRNKRFSTGTNAKPCGCRVSTRRINFVRHWNM
jgi:thioredoxin-related protein